MLSRNPTMATLSPTSPKSRQADRRRRIDQMEQQDDALGQDQDHSTLDVRSREGSPVGDPLILDRDGAAGVATVEIDRPATVAKGQAHGATAEVRTTQRSELASTWRSERGLQAGEHDLATGGGLQEDGPLADP